jgi:hypothetical protein
MIDRVVVRVDMKLRTCDSSGASIRDSSLT